MAGPFDPVRAAVAGYSAARPVTPEQGDVLAVFEPVVPAVAVLAPMLGRLVARFPATGYARWLDYLTVECTVVCPVDVYAGAIAPPSRITSYGDGSLADYSPATGRYIAQGAPLFVVWRTATGSASANAQFRQAS